jgi:beta-lactamase class A
MKVNIRMGKTHMIVALVLLNVVSAYLIYSYFSSSGCKTAQSNEFELLSERVAWLNADDFLASQQNLTISYTPLKENATSFFAANSLTDRYSLYFEDLRTGAWVGIGEKTRFLPASLLKLPAMVGVLKKVEVGDMSLDQTVRLNPLFLDNASGTLYKKGAGYEITVRGLLEYLIKESDNTALRELDSLLTEDEYSSAVLSMGYPAWNPEVMTLLSPKEYANGLRSLYYSTYLHRDFSNLALSILSSTDYNTQLTAALPADIKVAHKYGAYLTGGYFHDCGIIYLPSRPYMLCIMSHDSSVAESDRMISGLSRMVFDYMSR